MVLPMYFCINVFDRMIVYTYINAVYYECIFYDFGSVIIRDDYTCTFLESFGEPI